MTMLRLFLVLVSFIVCSCTVTESGNPPVDMPLDGFDVPSIVARVDNPIAAIREVRVTVPRDEVPSDSLLVLEDINSNQATRNQAIAEDNVISIYSSGSYRFYYQSGDQVSEPTDFIIDGDFEVSPPMERCLRADRLVLRIESSQRIEISNTCATSVDVSQMRWRVTDDRWSFSTTETTIAPNDTLSFEVQYAGIDMTRNQFIFESSDSQIELAISIVAGPYL